MTPLNKALYDSLTRTFGDVKVANEGSAFQAKLARDPLKPERTKVVGAFGEYYCVCCPWCHDSRFRLWVNHRWGTRLSGEVLKQLYVCYNEHCESDPKFREWLEDRLSPYVARGLNSQVRVARGTLVSQEPQAISLPESTPLYMLPKSHPVLDYLRGRGFDPVEMGEHFDVRWCEENPRLPPNNRLMFPIYDTDLAKVVRCYGFQSRFYDVSARNGTPDKTSGEVKWYTAPGTKASRLLYNGFRCRGSKLVVIAEGPLDVMSIGVRFGVATFGKNPSRCQQDLLWKHWGQTGAIGVLAYDYDAWIHDEHGKAAQNLEEMERRMHGAWRAVVRVRFDKDQDPGSTPRRKLYDMILTELRKIGGTAYQDALALLG